MSENMQTSIPSGADTINTDQIKKSSARTCSVISFYKNAYTALAVTTSGLLLHIGLFNISDGALVSICILFLIGLGVGLIGMFTMSSRIDKINRLTQSLVETIGRRSATLVKVEAVSVLSEVLADYKSIPCAAFWRLEPFVLKEISL